MSIITNKNHFADFYKKYDSAIVLLAEALKTDMQEDFANFPELADKSLFEYIQHSLQFDEMCAQIEIQMRKLPN